MTGPAARRLRRGAALVTARAAVLGVSVLGVSVLGASMTSGGAAADDFSPSFTIQVENDYFGRTDKDYTTGIRIAWLSGDIDVPDWVESLTETPRLFGSDGNNTIWRWGLSINQNIYTPEDTSLSQPIPDDRPYAAWLSAGVTLQAIHRSGTLPIRMDTFDLSLGVVGPWALGEELQNNFHNLIDDDETQGWGNQLDNEPAIQFTYERRWRTDAWDVAPPLGLEADAVPYFGLGLGNVQTYGAVGGIVRIGQDLRKDFGPPSVRPALPGSEAFSDKGVSWYLFAGVEGRAVANNIFLDGNSFQDGPSVDTRHLVGEAKAGVAVFFGDVRLAYTHVLRSPEFHERDRVQQFGAVSLGFSF